MDEIDYKLIELENKQLRAENERLKREFKPIIHAKVIYGGSHKAQCGNCKRYCIDYDQDGADQYCCCCGARMDGGK